MMSFQGIDEGCIRAHMNGALTGMSTAMLQLMRSDIWVLYNCGVSVLGEEDLFLAEVSWENTYNRNWHDSSIEEVSLSIDKLRELQIIASSEDELFTLTERGKKFWEWIAEPNWEQAYEWRCSSPENDIWDYHISISAKSLTRVLEIVLQDFNDATYSIVDMASFATNQPCQFSPLHWVTLSHGWNIQFDAMRVDQSLDSLTKKASLKILKQNWFLSFEEAWECYQKWVALS